jgi:hypothetical protein
MEPPKAVKFVTYVLLSAALALIFAQPFIPRSLETDVYIAVAILFFSGVAVPLIYALIYNKVIRGKFLPTPADLREAGSDGTVNLPTTRNSRPASIHDSLVLLICLLCASVLIELLLLLILQISGAVLSVRAQGGIVMLVSIPVGLWSFSRWSSYRKIR